MHANKGHYKPRQPSRECPPRPRGIDFLSHTAGVGVAATNLCTGLLEKERYRDHSFLTTENMEHVRKYTCSRAVPSATGPRLDLFVTGWEGGSRPYSP